MSKQKTNEEFLIDFAKNGNPNVIIIGKYVNNKTKILVKCMIDGYEWYAYPHNLLNGTGCPVCSGQIVVEGINDLATVRPDLVKYFVDQKDATKVTVSSGTKLNFKCPDCHTIKKPMFVSMLSSRGFNCKVCGDGISFPNKFSRALLQQLPVKNVDYEYNPDWLKPYSYDNYFQYKNQEYILEMDGSIGHGNKQWGSSGQDIEGLERDKIKDALAEKHNIVVIRIDCTKSEKDYIVQGILNSKLSNIFDLSNIDWVRCEQYAMKNIVKSVCDEYNNREGVSIIEIAKKHGISRNTVRNYLKIGSKFGWCDYNTKESVDDRNLRLSKKVNAFDIDQNFINGYCSTKACARELTDFYGVKFYDTNISRSIKTGKPYHNLYFQYA